MWTKEKKPWIILNEKFTSQKAVMTRLRTIAERHHWKVEGLHPLNPDDEAFVLAFFAEHSAIEEKIGAGVKRVLVGSSKAKDGTGYENWCYYFDTIDREIPVDIGAMSCFKVYTPLDDFTDACYTSVEKRATAVVNRDFGASDVMLCPETGETVSKQYCFVAYCSPSMREIVRQFISLYGIDVNAVAINGEVKRVFQDQEISKAFFAFHGELARMRVIGPTAFFKRMQRMCLTVPIAKDSVGI